MSIINYALSILAYLCNKENINYVILIEDENEIFHRTRVKSKWSKLKRIADETNKII